MENLATLKDPYKEKRIYKRRVLIALLGVTAMAVLLTTRYYYLQVAQYSHYATQADSNRIHVQTVNSPARFDF